MTYNKLVTMLHPATAILVYTWKSIFQRLNSRIAIVYIHMTWFVSMYICDA